MDQLASDTSEGSMLIGKVSGTNILSTQGKKACDSHKPNDEITTCDDKLPLVGIIATVDTQAK